ncbi:hypothetical protein [Novosphingobium colocasiae]|uniref:hypothetical protein n=1 Tax=Novosphingobium colocasiae TaxID=1256513 RepID=UPI0035B33E47
MLGQGCGTMDMAADPLRSDRATAGEAHPRVVVHWPLTVLPAVMLGVLMLRPIWDFDLFWQLRLGQMMLEHGGLLTREPFSAPHLGEALPALSWLAQIIMAAVFEAFGWTGLRLLDALAWLGGLWIVALAARRRGACAPGLCAGLAIAFIAAHAFSSVRPQSFALLAFGAVLALVRMDWPLRRTLVPGAIVLVLWQNLHPSVSIAAIAMAGMALPGWLAWLRDRRAPLPLAPSALAVLALLAVFATPDGASLLTISARNAAEARGIGVAEWLPLWSPLNAQFAPLVVVAGIAAAVLLVRGRARLDAGEVMVAVVLGVMTLLAIRFAVFWAVALVAPIARAVPGPVASSSRVSPAGTIGLGVIAVALAQAALPSPFADQIPLRAITALKRAHVAGTLFTDNYGGPLIHAGAPEWRVAYDGRYWRYTSAEWDRFRAIQHGRLGLAEVERIYAPAGFLVSKALNPGLVAQLDAAATRWRPVYADDQVAAFVRTRR